MKSLRRRYESMDLSTLRLCFGCGTILALLVACGEDPGSGGSVAVGEEAEASNGDAVIQARPANVPANYMATPNGWFHPDCVIEMDDDERIRHDGFIEHSLGELRKIQPCTVPRYDKDGATVDETAFIGQPTVNRWVESANSTKLGPIKYVHAQWNVPGAPASNHGQTVYYFPGLENRSHVKSILQPVLAWNQGGSRIAGWSLASWNCCVLGTTYHTRFIPVTGNTVSGDISGSGCSHNGVCSSWQIVSYDEGSGRSVTLNTTSFGVALNWLFGAALEAYKVRSCNQFPAGTVEFSAFYIDIAPSGKHVATPKWDGGVNRGISPSCRYGITYPGSGAVVLHY